MTSGETLLVRQVNLRATSLDWRERLGEQAAALLLEIVRSHCDDQDARRAVRCTDKWARQHLSFGAGY